MALCGCWLASTSSLRQACVNAMKHLISTTTLGCWRLFSYRTYLTLKNYKLTNCAKSTRNSLPRTRHSQIFTSTFSHCIAQHTYNSDSDIPSIIPHGYILARILLPFTSVITLLPTTANGIDAYKTRIHDSQVQKPDVCAQEHCNAGRYLHISVYTVSCWLRAENSPGFNFTTILHASTKQLNIPKEWQAKDCNKIRIPETLHANYDLSEQNNSTNWIQDRPTTVVTDVNSKHWNSRSYTLLVNEMITPKMCGLFS